jgi:AcrR family transcriptional regulator
MDDKRLTRGQQTRAEIVQVAHGLFMRQGFHGTSVRQIAQHAGITLSTIYNHFDSKEELFEVVFLEYHPYHEVIPALLAAEGDSEEAWVRDAAGRLVEALEQRPDFLNLMFIELVELNSVHITELFKNILPQAQLIAERFLNSQPGVRPIPPLILVRTFLGLFFSYYITEKIMGASAPPEFHHNAMDHFVDIYLKGILKDG